MEIKTKSTANNFQGFPLLYTQCWWGKSGFVVRTLASPSHFPTFCRHMVFSENKVLQEGSNSLPPGAREALRLVLRRLRVESLWTAWLEPQHSPGQALQCCVRYQAWRGLCLHLPHQTLKFCTLTKHILEGGNL